MGTWTRKTVEGPTLTIEDSLETDNACVIEGSRHLHILKHDRRYAAQALAGDKYRVILADTRDHRAALEAEINLLASDNDELTKKLRDAETQAAQPDRPEPVDPASVRVGQVVEIEADDGSWMVRARVADTDDPSNDGPPYPDDSPFGVQINKLMWWPVMTGATVRVLQPAEPEPDEAAVEAVLEAMLSASDLVTDADTGDYDIRDWARELVRCNVRVVSSDE